MTLLFGPINAETSAAGKMSFFFCLPTPSMSATAVEAQQGETQHDHDKKPEHGSWEAVPYDIIPLVTRG